MSTPKTAIAESLDDFNVEDFVDTDFTANAADKIIADLEDAGFRIERLTIDATLSPSPATQDSPTRPDGLGGAGETFADASDSEWDDLFFAIDRGTSVNSARKWRERLNALRAALAAKPAPAAVDPVAWRIYCTNNGATGYLYTEALPFEPGPGVVVRREPEPLYAEPAAVGEVREASREEIARIIDPDAFADPNALSPIARFIREARLPERQIAALAKSDAILDLSSLPAGSGEWQPIETAPDKTQILAVENFRRCDDEGRAYEEDYQVVTRVNGKWLSYGIYLSSFEPTHWKPLPAPPRNVTDSEALSTGEDRA